MESLLNTIKTWIETESGPSYAKFSIPDLQLKVTIMGYKKIILERNFHAEKSSQLLPSPKKIRLSAIERSATRTRQRSKEADD